MITHDRHVTSVATSSHYPLVVQRAQGSIVEDVDGNRFLDFTAGVSVCSTGHCHAHVVRAIEKQARKLIHIGSNHFCNESMLTLADKLAEISPGRQNKRVLLTNSGTEAVEAAIKLARHYTGRKNLVAFYGAFHGPTMGALSLSASESLQRQHFGPFVPMVHHVPYGDLDAIENRLFKMDCTPGEVAAIFVEPILADAGHIVPPAGFLEGLRTLCDRHGILLVVDETRTGMGRTGKMFCCEYDNLVPDLLLLAGGIASGLPLGALIAHESIATWPRSIQGSTCAGNPISCAAALATIDLLERRLIDNATDLAPMAMTKLQQVAHDHRCITAPRGRGLMLAVDVVKSSRSHEPDPKLRDRILAEAFSRGLLLLGCGPSSIFFTPPLCMNRVQLEVGLDVFDEAVATVAM